MQTLHAGAPPGPARWWLALRGAAARHVLLVDALIAVVPGGSIVWGTLGEMSGPSGRPGWPGTLLVTAAAAALLLRRRAPLRGFAASYGATLAFLLLGYPFGPVIQLAGLAMYAVAAWTPTRTSAAVCAAAAACYLPLEAVYRWTGKPPFTALLLTAAWLVLPWLLGAGVRAYRAAVAEAAAADRRESAYAERLRIAREVHDVVGHSLAVISMQAGVALHVLDRGPGPPPDVAEALRAIRTASTGALGELRAALSDFPGPDGTRVPPPGPGPGLDRLPALAASVAGPALDVDVVVEGERGSIAAPVDLAAYRIAQEALTNVVRHSGARRASVRVAYDQAALRLTVTDDGPGAAGGARGTGRGLAGMRERAAALGGTLHAGPRADGPGFEVAAVLPRGGAAA
ncbi:histidine kinase [Actinomadura sp. NPDC048394]|uniref:sensor histidine kinase n=1 Tax=Actinomadura sp. NPDC048394 TaxID=3158223 RepID=UPI0033C7F371